MRFWMQDTAWRSGARRSRVSGRAAPVVFPRTAVAKPPERAARNVRRFMTVFTSPSSRWAFFSAGTYAMDDLTLRVMGFTLLRQFDFMIARGNREVPVPIPDADLTRRLAIDDQAEFARIKFGRGDSHGLVGFEYESQTRRRRLIVPHHDPSRCLEAKLAVAGESGSFGANRGVIGMAVPGSTAEFAARGGIECPEAQAIPGGLINILLQRHEAEQRAPRVVRIASAVPSPGKVLLVVVLVHLPVIHEEPVAFLRNFQGHLIEPVAREPPVGNVIRRAPDAATPVVLVGKRRVIARDGWYDVLAPEFPGVQQVLLNHSLCLLGRRNAGEHGVEAGRREAL